MPDATSTAGPGAQSNTARLDLLDAATSPRAPSGPGSPLHLLRQSVALSAGGQSLLDPSRDVDGDGRADPLHAPHAGVIPTAATVARPSDQGRELFEMARLAIDEAALIVTGLLPTYANALDELDPLGVQAAAVEILFVYLQIAEVQGAIHAHVAGDVDSPQRAADHGLLTPMRGAVDAAVVVAKGALGVGLGPGTFRGQPVIAGLAPVRAHDPREFARLLMNEVALVLDLLEVVQDVEGLTPAATDATAEGVSLHDAPGASEAAARVRPYAQRPVAFAFLRAALMARGIWSQIEHVHIAGDLRTLHDVGADVRFNAVRFGASHDLGAYDASLAAMLLYGAPGRAQVVEVLGMINSAAPAARGRMLRDLDDRGLLEGFAARLRYDEAEALHHSIHGEARVAALLRAKYGDDPHTGDNTVSGLFARVPYVGGGLRFVGNAATFGFLEEHDASHRAMVTGEISEEEHGGNAWMALGRAGAVAAASLATGGAAGAYVERLAAGLAARGLAGRIAANTAVGAVSGAAGNVGARAASDLVDRDLSSLSTYGHDALIGGAVGGGLGFGLSGLGAAAARYVPDHLKTPINRLVERLPTLADDGELFGAIRALGDRHSQGLARFTATAAKVLRLVGDGVVILGREVRTALADPFIRLRNLADDLTDGFGGPGPGASPQPVASGGGGGGGARFTFTVEAARPLHVPGPDGPVLHIVKAERLPNELVSHADELADPFGGLDAVDMIDANNPRTSSWADVESLSDDFVDELVEGDVITSRDLPSRYADLLDEHGDGLTYRTYNDAQQSGIVPDEGAVYTDQHHVFPDEHREWLGNPENVAQPFDVDDFTLDIEHELHGTLHAGRGEWAGEWNANILARLRDARDRAGHPLTIPEMQAIARQELHRFNVPEGQYRRYTGTKDTAARRKASRNPPRR